MMIVGGDLSESYVRQISIVESCGLRKIGELPFNFYNGACNSFRGADGIQTAILCFQWEAFSECFRKSLK